jgi:multiple sugar transport system permease protein
MSASAGTPADQIAATGARRLSRLRRFDLVGLIITLATCVVAILWAFPLYWGVITTFKPEYEVVRPGVQLWPEHFTFENYLHVLM